MLNNILFRDKHVGDETIKKNKAVITLVVTPTSGRGVGDRMQSERVKEAFEDQQPSLFCQDAYG